MASLIWARLRYRPAPRLLVALGVAVATVLPVLAQSGSAIVVAQAVRHGIEQLQPGQRSLVVSYANLRLPSAELATVDRDARRGLTGLAARPPRREMLSRLLADGTGGVFLFGAADNLLDAVRITSGRAPDSCTPQRCEVLAVGTAPLWTESSLGIVVVGRAVRTDPLLLTGPFDPGHDEPLLLADGVDRASQLDSFATFQRSYGWVTPIDLDRVQRLGVAGYLARSARAGNELWSGRPGMALTAPDAVLSGEDARAHRSVRRFGLLGGAATALLLSFAAIGAIGLRRDHAALTGVLRRRGAARWTVGLITAVESATPVIVGTLTGVLLGGALAAWLAPGAGLPVWASTVDAVRAATVAVVAGAACAGGIVGSVLAWPGGTGTGTGSGAPGEGRTARRAIDAIVLIGLLVAGLALARGTVSAAALSERTDPLLFALPAIAVVCGGLLVGRVWPALVASAGRLLPRDRLSLRLGLIGGLGRPLRPVATVAFLAAATGFVVFAGAYQATLRQGAADQAAFVVPLDARISTGSLLERPLDVAPVASFAGLAPGVTVHPVLRASAGVRVSATSSLTTEVLGVDPAGLTRFPTWSRLVGRSTAAEAARLISAAPAAPSPGPASAVSAAPVVARPGIAVPPGTGSLAFNVSGATDHLVFVAWLRSPDGRDVGLQLAPDAGRLSATVPPELAGTARLFALTLAEEPHYADRRQHRIGEGRTDAPALAGTVLFGPPDFSGGALADGAPAAPVDAWTGWTSTGATVTSTDRGLTVSYGLNGAQIVVRAGAVVPGDPTIPVLADPVVAAQADHGVLQLVVNGNESVPARVVGVLPRFPTVGERFVVADVAALAEALDAREPGTGSIQELWLRAPPGRSAILAHALAGAPYDRLRVELRQRHEDELAADPVARGAANILTYSALPALLLAVVALVLLVVADRRDESAELYAWESDGVAPTTLRFSLFVRAAAVVAVAVPGGLLIGLVLAGLTTALVTVTAVGTTPTPPLALAIGPLWIAVVLAVGAVIGLVASGVVAAAGLRERLPRRPEGVLW